MAQFLRNHPEISLGAMTKIQIASVNTADDEAEIRNRCLPNTSLEYYCYIELCLSLKSNILLDPENADGRLNLLAPKIHLNHV